MGLYPPPETSRLLSTEQISLVQSLPSNDLCIECNGRSEPDLVSVTYGIFLCRNCANIHRRLGLHLSALRSLTKEYWADDQYCRMVHGGNAKWKEYWEIHGNAADAPVSHFCHSLSDESISESGTSVDHESNILIMEKEEFMLQIHFKYNSNAARAYREILSLNTKARRSNGDLSALFSSPSTNVVKTSTTLSTRPSFQDAVVLPVEYPPSFQVLLTEQGWPITLATMSSRKSQAALFVWAMFGIASAHGAQGCGMFLEGNDRKDGYFNFFALSILALIIEIPYFLLRRFAIKIAQSLLDNRQDAFKSARNALIDRITIGRAQRFHRCDVYYPVNTPQGSGSPNHVKCGMIFYPEALVDRTAYAPIASRLSELGILVAVANHEPYRVVTKWNECDLREEVMLILSDAVLLGTQGAWTVDEWAIGGHATGAHIAIAVAANEVLHAVKKVVLWGVQSYPDSNTYPCKRTLRESKDVNALVLNGSNDDIIKSAAYKKDGVVEFFKANMPPASSSPSFVNVALGDRRGCTQYVDVKGGNHAGCAHYGPHMFPHPDGIRTITLEQQQRQMAEVTVDFLFSSTKAD